MGNRYGKFKLEIDDKIQSNNRNLIVIDRGYRDVEKWKNGKSTISHQKWYKYKCLNCGNEDWMIEYSLAQGGYGCNVCCMPPKKIVYGINDITTTAPWMTKYFANIEDAKCRAKYSKDKLKMVCPDCGRIHYKAPYTVYANRGLSCPCGDGISYPNKFMYSLMEQVEATFEIEKRFDWSQNRVYDMYIEYNGLRIVVENHGVQHYKRNICGGRSVEEEQANDTLKMELALQNGIDRYFQIDCSKSDVDFLKDSIGKSGLLDCLNMTSASIDWNSCDEFATSNLAKEICLYKNDNPDVSLRKIADEYKIAYVTVLRYIKSGNKLGWCSYEMNEDLEMGRKNHTRKTTSKPIMCLSNGEYYRDSQTFVDIYIQKYGKKLNARNIRHVCEGKRNHVHNLNFEFITQEQFNKIKSESPAIAHGDFFIL